ncbi:MAG: C39 family peptidase [Chloroflexi bacterium]|nr:C39 family peptidase [Chloroflexota bacterium]
MGGPVRVVGLIVIVAAVLASCGLAPVGTSVLVPAAPAPYRADTLMPFELPSIAATAAAPVHEPALLQKVVLPEPAVVPAPALSAGGLKMKHVWQSLNNCGPASVVMILSSLGIEADQESARLALRGPNWARGMGPTPVDAWVKEQFGVRATWRNNGTNALMKALISNGFAPMVTQWLEDPWVSRISHWRAVQGYDDARGVFNVYDPLRGRISLSYEWFDRNWQPFAYRYLVVHTPEQEPLLRAILGAEWSERTVRERLFLRARTEAIGRNDSASWLAYGEAAYGYGLYAEAVSAFEKGLALGSAQGVFTLRSSYAQALRALGRSQDADRVQRQFSTSAPQPAVVPAAEIMAQEQALELARSEQISFSE